jgi:hypothetical protein
VARGWSPRCARPGRRAGCGQPRRPPPQRRVRNCPTRGASACREAAQPRKGPDRRRAPPVPARMPVRPAPGEGR